MTLGQDRGEAVIDLNAIRGNLTAIAAALPDVDIMAIVKADAYGHGAVAVARAAREAGVPWLGVALPGEALQLRDAGDEGRVLAWLLVPGEPSIGECVGREVDLGTGSVWAVHEIADAARQHGVRARVHLKVDTGLGRGGSAPADWPALIATARSHADVLEIVGIWSHLACADQPEHPATAQQVGVFEDALATAASAGVVPEVRHLASSGAALTRPDTHYDLVRIGIAAYGMTPGPLVGPPYPHGLRMRPAMTLRARVSSLKRVPAGHGASYGLTWRAPQETSLALVPLGYADGLPRGVRGAAVSIGGVRYPIVGRMAMDQCVVDVGDSDVRSGDDVLVFGPGDAGEPTAEEWAAWNDTIGYEIVTRVGPRVPRRYVG